MVGYLELIIGPMFSGKSTKLISQLNRYQYGHKMATLLISHQDDNRYSNDGSIITHDSLGCSPDYVVKLAQLDTLDQDILNKVDAIAVDEGQFYPDLVVIIEQWLAMGKYILVAGLSGRYDQQPFQNIANLTAKADMITVVHAICGVDKCCKLAPFTVLIKPKSQSEYCDTVGGSNKYMPVCRTHLA